ncbi:MAG: response regulator [Chloroflexota bacterium]
MKSRGEKAPKKILVVDDDPDIHEALSMILESNGYQVISAWDGIEGLACLKAQKPDLMIMDLMMPKMDGFAVLRELRDSKWSEFRNTPIMILSSIREEASRRRYELETGVSLDVAGYVEKKTSPDVLVDDLVEKPFSPDIILRKVTKLLEKNQPSKK